MSMLPPARARSV